MYSRLLTLPITKTPSIGNSSLNDASFHPSGNSALIVGDNGTVLRYSDLDKSLTDAGVENLSGSDLLSVSWSLSGSWAYIGSSEGEIWRVRTSGDGGAEAHLLEGLAGQSPVTSIDCISEGMYVLFDNLQWDCNNTEGSFFELDRGFIYSLE